MNITIEDINSAIRFGNLTNQDLDSVIAAVRYARSQISQANKRQFRVGNQVRFQNQRRGRPMQGTVIKVAIKYVSVDCGAQGRWRVPAYALEAV